MYRIVFCMVMTLITIGKCGIATAQLSEIPSVCQSVEELEKKIVWKGCSGSGHLSGDPRADGVALIAFLGVAKPDTCIEIWSTPTEAYPNGKKIGAMRSYPGNDGKSYSWRHYSNYWPGCGNHIDQKDIKKRAGGKPIFLLKKKSTGRCIEIPKAYSNIHSKQGC